MQSRVAVLAMAWLVGAVSSAVGEGNGIPLIGEPPPWYTETVFARAVEASALGLGYDFAADRFVAAAAAPSQVLIRPGTQIFPESIFPGWCTAGFVFGNRKQIATAGHCTARGDRVLALAAPSTVFVFGITRSSTGSRARIGRDWALIGIDPTWRAFTDPTTALVGGPCGKTKTPSVPVIKYVGHGAGIGTGGTARVGLLDFARLNELLHDRTSAFAAIGATSFGDSGAPVLETTAVRTDRPCAMGAAVGILTHASAIAVDGEGLIPTGFFFGTPIGRIRARLDDATVP